MKPQLNITPEMVDLCRKNFNLLAPAGKNNKSFTLEMRVTGYNDVMHYMAHLIKVCMMALEAQDSFSSPYIPEPAINISSVMELLLNMIPYEETELLDTLYKHCLDSTEDTGLSIEEMNLWLIPPAELANA